MTWNRRNRRLERQSGVAPCLVVGVVALVAIALIYAWLNSRSEMLGRDLCRLEGERDKLVKQHLNEEYRWARLKSPQSLDKALADHRLTMGAPRHDQVVRLRDAPRSDGGLLAVLGGRVPRNDGRTIRE